MSDDVQFSCTACHLTDEKEVMTACNRCGRVHCTSCLDEHGNCVECKGEEEKTEK